MPFQAGYLSEIIGRSVIVDGERTTTVGRLVDFVVNEPGEHFPKVSSIVVKTRDGNRVSPIDDVIDLDRAGRLVVARAPTTATAAADEALFLVEDLFDKQIVDVHGRKVVRINDIEVAQTGGALRVVAADIGLSGLLRRMGVGKLSPRLLARVPRTIIAWDNVAPIDDMNPKMIRLEVEEHRLARLHPSELAAIISDLSASDASRIVGQLDDETAADALEHLDADTQRSILEDLGTERAADIIEEMDADDAADLLGDLPEDQQAELFAEMEPETAVELRELVRYEDDTAGGLMTTDYVWIFPHRTIGATIAKIREIGPESEFVYYLYVTDHDKTLLGVLSLRTLLLSSPDTPIRDVMDTEIVSVSPLTPAEEVAGMIAQYDLLACPVVDEQNRMLGIVTVDDAIDAIIPEKVKKRLPRFTHRHRKQPT
jgi:magnesium transporter